MCMVSVEGVHASTRANNVLMKDMYAFVCVPLCASLYIVPLRVYLCALPGATNLLAIQIDAAINPGNSGGPALKDNKVQACLLNMHIFEHGCIQSGSANARGLHMDSLNIK